MNHLNRALFRLAPGTILLAMASCLSPQSTDMTPTTPHVQYLEFVTPDVDATCATYEAALGVSFSDPIPEFGNARTAEQAHGGWIGVRGPMRADESPTTRAYVLVEDIAAAVAAAAENGAEIAMPPTPIPGRGMFAIYIQGGVQHALWQN